MRHNAGMPRGKPILAEEASDQARMVHAFLVSRGLSMRGWSVRAGLSRNVLGELFAGRTRSLTYGTLAKLAAAEGVPPAQIVGASADELLVTLAEVREAAARWAASRGLPDPENAATEITEILLSR